jgi:hypothetical protein
VAISRKNIGDKKATKSVILGTISYYTLKFATVWNLAQICFFGYKLFS